MKINVINYSRLAAFAGMLLWIPIADGAFLQIPAPNVGYTSSTTLLPITGSDAETTTTLSDVNLTVTFTELLQKFSVPDTWGVWGSPPTVETSTPRILSPAGPNYQSVNAVTLNFSQPLSIFGLEAEPDAFTQGFFPVTLFFYNGATELGSVTDQLDGSSAELFAASSDTPITSVLLRVDGNATLPEGIDFGIAQLRYSLAAPAAVPEPGTWLMGVAGIAFLAVRRFRSARS